MGWHGNNQGFLPSFLYYSIYEDGHSWHHLLSPGAAFDFTAVTTVLLTSTSEPCRELAVTCREQTVTSCTPLRTHWLRLSKPASDTPIINILL